MLKQSVFGKTWNNRFSACERNWSSIFRIQSTLSDPLYSKIWSFFLTHLNISVLISNPFFWLLSWKSISSLKIWIKLYHVLLRSSLSFASYLKIMVFSKEFLLSKPISFYTILLQTNFGLIIHFMVFTRFLNVLIKLWSASHNLFSNDSLWFLNKFNNDLISFLSI